MVIRGMALIGASVRFLSVCLSVCLSVSPAADFPVLLFVVRVDYDVS